MTPPTANARRREMVRERICYVCHKPCPEGRGLYYAGLGIMVHSDSECSALLHASMKDYSKSSRGRFRSAREIRESISGVLAPPPPSDPGGLPIVSAWRISGGSNAGRDLLVIECPFCGREHVHGGPRKGAPIGAANGVRIAHCASSDIREYRLREVAQ